MRGKYPEKVILELSAFEANHLEQLLYNRANDVFEPSFEETQRLYYRLRNMRAQDEKGKNKGGRAGSDCN